MTSPNRPSACNRRPLTEPQYVADIFDEFVTPESRRLHALYLFVGDEHDHLLQPVSFEGPAPFVSEARRTEVLRPTVEYLEECVDGVSLLAAIARPSGLAVTPDDEVWVRAITAALTSARFLGAHVVTFEGNRPIPIPTTTP